MSEPSDRQLVMTDSIFYALFWITIFCLWFRYSAVYKSHTELRKTLQFSFLLKVIVGSFFLYIYKQFYTSSDAYAFLNDSRRLYNVFHQSPQAYFSFLSGIGNTPALINQYLADSTLWSKGATTWFNDSANVIRINSLIYFISRGNAHVHVIFMSFISLTGLYNLALAFKNKINLKPAVFLIILVLIPSVLFWTSGILKEPFMILGLGFTMRGLLSEISLTKKIFLLIFGGIILLLIKPYLLICIALAVAYFTLNKYILSRHPVKGLIVFVALGTVILWCAPSFREKLTANLSLKQKDSFNVGKGGVYVVRDSIEMYYFQNADAHKLTIQDSFVTLNNPAEAERKWIYKRSVFEPFHVEPKGEKWKLYLALDSSTSLISMTPINYSFTRLLQTAPEALINASFRPFPFDSGSAFIYPAMLEVVLCFALLLYAIIYRRKLSPSEQRLVIAMLIFAVTLFLLIGWTTPVSGAIVRYRIPAYLALFIISIFVIRTEKLERFKMRKK